MLACQPCKGSPKVLDKHQFDTTQQLGFQFSRILHISGFVLYSLFLVSCSLTPNLAVVNDAGIERLVRDEAKQILAVSEDAANTSRYQIFLSDFPRGDILGMSIGQRRIYISHKLGSRALYSQRHLWLLRQTLAHEIAHESAGHANFRQVNFNRPSAERSMTSRDVGLPWYVVFQPYSMEKELQADLDGMRYWKRLHWNCAIWVRILEDFERQNYSGDTSHPTGTRLQQALRACRSEPS